MTALDRLSPIIQTPLAVREVNEDPVLTELNRDYAVLLTRASSIERPCTTTQATQELWGFNDWMDT